MSIEDNERIEAKANELYYTDNYDLNPYYLHSKNGFVAGCIYEHNNWRDIVKKTIEKYNSQIVEKDREIDILKSELEYERTESRLNRIRKQTLSDK